MPNEPLFDPGKLPLDPLSDSFPKRFIVYLVLLAFALVWPFDHFKKNHVDWISDSNGITFSGEGMVFSPSPASALYQKLVAGRGLTIDVWLAPTNTTQSGPARIVSYSLNPNLRNFTLGQDGKKLNMRLRTTKTSLNGTQPSLELDDVFQTAGPMHLVVTYDYTHQTVYIDGKRRSRSELPGGDFSTWNPSCYLIFGNEVGGRRPWRGSLFQVSIYNRPLGEQEIAQRYASGWRAEPASGNTIDAPSAGLLVRYRFDEGHGNQMYDTASPAHPVNLGRPGYLRRPASQYLRWPTNSLSATLKSQDTVFNVIGFVPLGFLLHGTLRIRRNRSWRLSAFVLFSGALLSFSFESIQYISMTRDSSAVDLIANTVGTLAGIMIDRSYIKSVHRYWDNRS